SECRLDLSRNTVRGSRFRRGTILVCFQHWNKRDNLHASKWHHLTRSACAGERCCSKHELSNKRNPSVFSVEDELYCSSMELRHTASADRQPGQFYCGCKLRE